MTAATSLAFPGSRALAGWWRQLAPLQPQSLWVGHLFLHRVECPVASVWPQALDGLNRFVLQAVAAEQARPRSGQQISPSFLQRLDKRLHLGPSLLRQILRALALEGLAEVAPHGEWALTAQGRAALERGEYPRTSHERRVFHFVEPAGGGTTSGQLPHFLYLNGHLGVPWPVGVDWSFDVNVLHACVRQPAAWKQQHSFPEEVREILPLAAGTAVPAWQRVIVDRPERLPVVLVLAGVTDSNRQFLGFAVRQERWALQATHPVFILREDWHAPFPELGRGPSETACRQAWRLWCQPRGLLAEDVEACDLRPDDLHLHVAAPTSLVERLRTARSDALKGEAWILIGEGTLRRAVVLDVRVR